MIEDYEIQSDNFSVDTKEIPRPTMTVNNEKPDANGNVEVEGGGPIDPTLSHEGEAADAKATGDAISQVSSSIAQKLPKHYTAADDGKALIIGGADHEAQPMTLPQGTVIIDPTLTIARQAADAKAVGDEFAKTAKIELGGWHEVVSNELSLTGETENSCEFRVSVRKGKRIKFICSTDVSYGFDRIWVEYNDMNSFSRVDVSQTPRFYNNVDTVNFEMNLENRGIYAVRIIIGNPTADGHLLIKVLVEPDTAMHVADNVLTVAEGSNLYDPSKITSLMGFHGAEHWITKSNTTDACISDYIELKNGESLTANKKFWNAALFVGRHYGASIDGTYISNSNTITNNTGAVAYAVLCYSEAKIGGLMVVKGTHPAIYIPYSRGGAYSERPIDESYGTLGILHPDETRMVHLVSSDQLTNRFHFVHASDLHGMWKKELGEFTDLSDAKFMAVTGDIINNTFSSTYDAVKNGILAMEKPCYIVMGNHDVWKSTNVAERIEKYFAPIAEHNGIDDDVNYYSVDYMEEGIKCIFLDVYENTNDFPTLSMSGTQISWLLSQLDDAITNSLHVCLFYHIYINKNEKYIEKFSDYKMDAQPNIEWIAEVIDAFIDGTSVSFTVDGTNYTHTFSSEGVFVAHFTGHSHSDNCGWLKGHNRQLHCNVLCTYNYSNYVYYDGNDFETAANYVTIDKSIRRLSVVRIGNNETIFGTKRDVFTVTY